MPIPQSSIPWYEERFAGFEKSLNGDRGTEVHALRKRAMAAFAGIGFPTTRNEEWRFTNVAAIAAEQFHLPEPSADRAGIQTAVDANALEGAFRLTFIDGTFDAEFSRRDGLPRGILLTSLREALTLHPELVQQHLGELAKSAENGFTALNTAFLRDGTFLFVPQGVVLERPVQLLFIATEQPRPALIQPRNLIIAGEQSGVTIAEMYVASAEAKYLTNVVTEMIIDDRAIVEHDRLQNESARAFHVGTLHVRQRTRSVFTSNSINVGGLLVRNTITVALEAEGCESTLNGLSLSAGTQLIDNHTAIDHASPRCASHELYKSILDGRSRGVFNGKIFVRKDAQKTDAKQTNKTLLLSDEATIDTKPQLEIFADDVKCTHGATVGQLDENQVFYLRSRGIDETSARDMLTVAFAADVVERVHIDSLRQRLEGMIHARLDRGRRNG